MEERSEGEREGIFVFTFCSAQEGGTTTRTEIGVAIARILNFEIGAAETSDTGNQDKMMKERKNLGKKRKRVIACI
jgi:hypothetical protein